MDLRVVEAGKIFHSIKTCFVSAGIDMVPNSDHLRSFPHGTKRFYGAAEGSSNTRIVLLCFMVVANNI